MINFNNNLSFKSYIPVNYYAKNPETGKYAPVTDNQNIRKCNGFIVRNLNGTLKNNKRDDFVDFYKSYDSDYKNDSRVHSVYDKNTPTVYLVTGNDVDIVREMAKPVGKAKGNAIEKLGYSNSFEAANAAKQYFSNVKSFLKNRCCRIKDENGNNLSLRIYFDPQYNKKNQLKGFELNNARFLTEQ